jgi:mRNA interferase MazF
MKLGDIVVVDFPFSNLIQTKIRPAVVITITNDNHKDVVLCLISSVVTENPTKREILLQPNRVDNLRAASVIKVYRLATVQRLKIISKIGRLSTNELRNFVAAFQSLVDPA